MSTLATALERAEQEQLAYEATLQYEPEDLGEMDHWELFARGIVDTPPTARQRFVVGISQEALSGVRISPQGTVKAVRVG